MNPAEGEKGAPVPSQFVKGIEGHRRAQLEMRGRVQRVVDQCRSLSSADLPPVEYMQKIGSNDADHFRDVMFSMFSELVGRFGLDNRSRVLDIGCGCGRLAIPFSYYLDSGRYYGVDVWDAGIEWCRKHLLGDRKHVEFQCLGSNNNYYFGQYDASVRNDYRMPRIADKSIDLVFAISVFTHLVERDVRSYLSEITRVLDEQGAAYISAFVIDEYFTEFVEKTGKHKSVKRYKPGAFYAYRGQDFFAGYTERKWRKMFKRHGLKVVSYEVGSWAAKPGARTFQDIFVVIRR